MHLGPLLGEIPAPPEQSEAGSTVPAHTRRKTRSDFTDDRRDAPFFDAAVVPVQTITAPNPEAQGLAPEQLRGHRREGQSSPGAAPEQLRRPQVRATRHQAPRYVDPALRAGASGRHRGQPRRSSSLRRRATGRQVSLRLAAVSPTPASARCRIHAQPVLAGARNEAHAGHGAAVRRVGGLRRLCPGRPASRTLNVGLRISAHRRRRFRLIVDAVSAGSWTMGVARKGPFDPASGSPLFAVRTRCQPTESRCARFERHCACTCRLG